MQEKATRVKILLKKRRGPFQILKQESFMLLKLHNTNNSYLLIQKRLPKFLHNYRKTCDLRFFLQSLYPLNDIFLILLISLPKTKKIQTLCGWESIQGAKMQIEILEYTLTNCLFSFLCFQKTNKSVYSILYYKKFAT